MRSIVVRATKCRREGHLYSLDGDHCLNCGAPWFFRWVRERTGMPVPCKDGEGS